MPLDGEYTPLTDSTLMGTMVDALPRDDIDLALTEITAALQGYDHAKEYDEINLWEQNMLSREGRTLRQADIEFDPNFCLGRETEIITRDGVRRLGDMAGETVEVWTAQGWHKGEIASFGRQRLYRATLTPTAWIEAHTDKLGRRVPEHWHRGGSRHQVQLRATAEHLWELADGTTTRALAPGDMVRGHVVTEVTNRAVYDAGWVHGIVFADGRQCNAKRTPHSRSYELRLCGAKADHLARLEASPMHVNTTHPAHAGGEPVVYLNSGILLKKLPVAADADYARGFLEGWLAGDGDHRPNKVAGATRLHTQHEHAEEWVRGHAALAGYFLTGHQRSRAPRATFPGGIDHTPQHDVHTFFLVRAPRAWQVLSVEKDEIEEVYCATVPDVHRFTLASGIYTGNCSPVIDAVNDRLLVSSVTATAGADTDTAASDTATTALAGIIQANEMDSRYRDWNRKALRDGDAYIIVWPDETHPADYQPELTNEVDPTDGLAPDPLLGVNITYADPRNARMFYDPQNPRLKRFFATMWETQLRGEKKTRIRMDLYYPDRIEKWISAPGNRQKTAKEFEPFLDPDDNADDDYPGSGADPDNDPAPAASWPMPNPFGQIPVFHLRTAYEYGKPVHANAFALQDAISKLVEMLMVTVEFNGYPQRYALQEADSLGTQSIREDPLAEHSPADWDHDFTETALSTTSVVSGAISNETGSNYEANPGAMQIYKGFKAVGSFTTATPGAFLDPFKNFVTSIATTTSTPLWKFQGLGGTTPSGEALRIAEMPLVQHALDLMAMLGSPYEDMYEFALLVIGVTAKVKIAWANPATSDLKETWDLVKAKIELGVPRDVAFMQAGISEAEAQEWAKTYNDVFATAAYYQGRADMYLAQAELLRQQAVAAKIANGVPQRVALIEDGRSEQDVDGWLADTEQERTLERKTQIFQQLTQGMQSLGMAVNLNVISEQGANQIVMSLFGELMPEIPSAELEVDEEDEPDPAAFPPHPLQPGMPGEEPHEGGAPPAIPGVPGLPPGTPAPVHIYDPNN